MGVGTLGALIWKIVMGMTSGSSKFESFKINLNKNFKILAGPSKFPSVSLSFFSQCLLSIKFNFFFG